MLSPNDGTLLPLDAIADLNCGQGCRWLHGNASFFFHPFDRLIGVIDQDIG